GKCHVHRSVEENYGQGPESQYGKEEAVMRIAKVARKTKETDISIELTIEGKGDCDINTSIPFLDHMLNLFAFHGLMDLKIRATGDLEVDYHHLMEDLGITMGEAIKKALAD